MPAALLAALGSAALLLNGCSLDVAEPTQVLWEATLEPLPPEGGLQGTSAAVSREFNTEVGIEVTGGEVGDRWIWRVREGTCGSPGPTVGDPADYPVLEAEEDTDSPAPVPPVGDQAETVLPVSLERGGEYHVSVASMATDTSPSVPLACGNFQRGSR